MLVRTWGWLSPGGLHGLQNRPKGAAEAALVGSTPIHSRLFVSWGMALPWMSAERQLTANRGGVH